MVKKLNQLAKEQRDKYDVLVEAKVDEIVNHILEIPAVRYYSVTINSLFPEIGLRSPPNQLAEHVLSKLVGLLRQKKLTVEIPYEDHCYPQHNSGGEIKITW